ncbi:ribonuclease H-like domain-containing protein [Dendryphion nanum]|uniref:Ribonuclease H-like domain-containing protein n=1 Tax=Dendryphion nanum TaxID=256645 RepID=A0A9P9EK41_9PLEO|nr:ribonuclease H-like domain-containing protein [Dendryphion nanum]
MEPFKAHYDTITAALVSTTRSATQLNTADIPFQRSLDPTVGVAIDAQNARLLHLAQRLLESAAAGSDAVGPKLPDVEAIDDNFKGIVDVIDSLREKADTSLDEYTGVVKRISPGVEQATTTPKSRFPSAPQHIIKPQLTFENVPLNNEIGAFRPLLSSKPHASIPLNESLKTFKDGNGREQYPHPYQTEIESYEYPKSMYEVTEPQSYTPFESTTATFVDTPEALAAMLSELKTAKEIAIDLEHHDNRSYIGLVSLMQISTRDKDWIIDTLKPWRRRLECLNEVFADPNIIKVLHGSYMDIVWLQRDLGLYIVGLFDTYHAARSLGYPGASLAFLLDKFVNFKAQKQYQMADWRIRPLSDELFNYARADTHFLLYVFDNMRNELIQKSDFADPDRNKVLDVLNKSRETALQRFETPIYDTELGLGPVGWYKLISRTPVQYTPQQFAVFRAVHKWRDDVARQEDESPMFIMPNHAVFSIARTLPKDKAALFNVIQHVSHIVRARSDQLVNLIQKAKDDGEDGPDLNETIKKIGDIRFPNRVQSDPVRTTSSDIVQPVASSDEGPPATTLDTQALRAPASIFWGALYSKAQLEQRRSSPKLSINLALPLPPLTAEMFADPKASANEHATPTAEKPAYIPKEERVPEDNRTDIFVVKQLGGKRKRAPVETSPEQEGLPSPTSDDGNMGESSEANEIMLEADEKTQRIRAKEAKKAAKLRKKEREQAKRDEGLEYGEEQEFDYANAPSVLNAQAAERKKEKGMKKKDRKKKDAGFNPYGQLGADAPRGLPRAQRETTGKTKTFSS